MLAKAYTTQAGDGGKLFSDAPSANVSGTVTGVVAAAAAATPQGALVAQVLAIIGSLGGLVKGKTGHASYAVVAPLAATFAGKVYNSLKDSLGAAFETTNKSIVPAVQRRFLAQMSAWWGLGPSLNQAIATDLQKIQTMPIPVYELLWRFYLWVGTNVDQDSGADEKAKIFEALYTEIFLDGFSEAGVSLQKVAEDVAGFATGKTAAAATAAAVSAKLAGFGGTIGLVMILGLGGALLWGFRQARGAA
jgi:hypothetical protein